jgi:hypothetical protein
MAEGGAYQDTERSGPSEADSRSEDGRGRDLSEYRKKLTEHGALTSWRRQREGLVRPQKETERARGIGTHILGNAEGRPNQYIDTMYENSKRAIIGSGTWNMNLGPSFSNE